MGLIRPTKGTIEVDGLEIYDKDYPLRYIDWRNSISHVPQNIFLLDSTIAENIAFNFSKKNINFEKVKEAAKLANLEKFIESLPNTYFTSIGEDGIKLSGGQRQRIGIARALYKESEVLVFDEATSSLDVITEELIMKTIYKLRKFKTIFIISHRLNTLKNCDKLIKFPIL